MVVKIRLVPVGKANQRSYHIRVIDSRKPRESGNYLEHLGYLNLQQEKMELNHERYQWRLQHGAQPTDSLNVRCNKLAIINTLENLPSKQIKVELPESNFKVKDLKKKLKENNYWLIKGVLLGEWEKGLVEKIFKNNRFRIESIFSNQKKTKPLGEEEEISRPLSSFNFEFSITLPKEVRTKTTYITKNNPVFILELKNN